MLTAAGAITPLFRTDPPVDSLAQNVDVATMACRFLEQVDRNPRTRRWIAVRWLLGKFVGMATAKDLGGDLTRVGVCLCEVAMRCAVHHLKVAVGFGIRPREVDVLPQKDMLYPVALHLREMTHQAVQTEAAQDILAIAEARARSSASITLSSAPEAGVDDACSSAGWFSLGMW